MMPPNAANAGGDPHLFSRTNPHLTPSTTSTMKEIPFLQHLDPFPMNSPSSPPFKAVSSSVSSSASPPSNETIGRKQFIASLLLNYDENKAIDLPSGATGISLQRVDEHGTNRDDTGRATMAMSTSTALALVPNDANGQNALSTISDNNPMYASLNRTTEPMDMVDPQEESYQLRGLTSSHYSDRDNKVICTHGVPGKRGTVVISVRDSGYEVVNGSESVNGVGHEGNAKKEQCRDVEVDLSQLLTMNRGKGSGRSTSSASESIQFDSPVGTACFVRHAIAASKNVEDKDNDQSMEYQPTEASDSSSNRSLLHLHTVDPYGTVLSLTFSYPDLEPIHPTSPAVTSTTVKAMPSFLLPLTPPKPNLQPHPGSSIEVNQVCFPTPTTIVFAMMPHLYCVDVGDDPQTQIGHDTPSGVTRANTVVTRVWTDIHRVVSDRIAGANAGSAGGGSRSSRKSMGGVPSSASKATPRKKSRQSLGNILTRAGYALVGVSVNEEEEMLNKEFEYEDEAGEELDLRYDSSVPPVAAVASLNSLSVGDEEESPTIARVATLHSDGSLRIWAAEPSKKRKEGMHSVWEQEESDGEEVQGIDFVEARYSPKFRIPSVQRVDVSSADSSLPHPSTWDSSRDSIVLRGHHKVSLDGGDPTYELALYVQCFQNKGNLKRGEEDSRSMYVFQGSLAKESDIYNDSPSSSIVVCMQKLTLPSGSQSIIDCSWDAGKDLIVLLRCIDTASSDDGMVSSFHDGGLRFDEFGTLKTVLAVYPVDTSSSVLSYLGSSKSSFVSYSAHYIPSNKTLTYLDLNQTTKVFCLTVEEELDRFLIPLMVADKDKIECSDSMDTDSSGDSPKGDSMAQIDKAGLHALLFPSGRPRPSALAVCRAMSRLGLMDYKKYSAFAQKESSIRSSTEQVRPGVVVAAIRKWQKRGSFQPSSSTALALTGGEGSEAVGYVKGASRNVIGSSVPTTKNISIYHAFASATKSSVDKSTAAGNARSEYDDNSGVSMDQSGSGDVGAERKAYRMLWIKFLSEVRQQEAKLNEILCITSASMPAASDIIVVRGRTMSAVLLEKTTPPVVSQEEARMAMLDELALDLFTFIMSDRNYRLTCCELDSMFYDAASKALALVTGWQSEDGGNKLVKQIAMLGMSALNELSLKEEQYELLENISQIDLNFADAWLQSPSSSSPEVCRRFCLERSSPAPLHSKNVVAGDHGIDFESSAASIVTTRLESTRQLVFSRLLLVLGLKHMNIQAIQDISLRLALYTAALTWAVNQPSSNKKESTVLEEHLSRVMSGVNVFALGIKIALPLADSFISNAFSFITHDKRSASILNLVSPSEEPRIALRLLAPIVEFSPISSLGGSILFCAINRKRKEVTAECVLMEAAAVSKRVAKSNCTSPQELWDLASNLLLDQIPMESIDSSRFQDIFEGLKDGRDQWWTFPHNPRHDNVLFEVLSMILRIGDSEGKPSRVPETEEEIQLLCAMQSLKSLLLPIVISSSERGVSIGHGFVDWLLSNISLNVPISRLSLYQFVRTMMKISNLIHRLGSLERYLSVMSDDRKTLSACCEVVLAAIQDAISTINAFLPPQMTQDLPEVPMLWSMAFQISMKGSLWHEALQACFSNPLDDLKKQNFKRLVLGMIDTGGLNELIDMSLPVVGHHSVPNDLEVDENDPNKPSNNSTSSPTIQSGVDVFDLASKVIEDAAFEQATISSVSSEKSNEPPNYWGCLYSLHASRGNWREAARAMDMCGRLSSAYAKDQVSSNSSNNKVMDIASLSAQACSHVISLVDNPAYQYILPGEKQGAASTPLYQEEIGIHSASRLLTKEDLKRRADRALALRVLSKDELSPDSVMNILKSSSRDAIKLLVQLGYYDEAITVASGLASKHRSRPGGMDLFDDALSYILCKSLVPAAVRNIHKTSDEDADEDELFCSFSRPTEAQMQSSSSSCILSDPDKSPHIPVASSSVNSTCWVSNKRSEAALQKAMANDLLQQYTTFYSKTYSKLGLDVARAFLESDTASDLPQWLKDLCTYGTSSTAKTAASSVDSFGQRKTGDGRDTADPAGLIRLYMAHGKYQDACHVVVSILSLQNSRHDISSRLPEKGSIDFVPYDLIDRLWHVIETIASKPAPHSGYDKPEIDSLLNWRSRMENSLEKHFELLKISEEGLKSARALSHT